MMMIINESNIDDYRSEDYEQVLDYYYFFFFFGISSL